MTVLGALVHRGDLAELVREVDRLAGRGDWDVVLDLRDRCLRAAEEVGKQLWGPAQYAEYRTALDAPAPVAASVLAPGAARFALGPLTEVVAQHHAWDELADHLVVPVLAATVAQERVIRGEDLEGDDRARPDELELPLVLQPWEPDYPVPLYREDEVTENGPAPQPGGEELGDTRPGRPTDLPAVARALRDVVAPWSEQSTGEVHVATVTGGAPEAIAALVPGAARLRRVALDEAFAHLVWAGATGGALGRRRGMAAGRAAAFWLAHVVTGLAYPADPDELEFHLEELDWYVFDDGGERPGWVLRLAVSDAGAGWGAAIDAHDQREDEDDDA